MSNNYFMIDDLPIRYPIHILINGRNWNFQSEYLKKIRSLTCDTSHKLFDLLVDTEFFSEIGKVYKNIPFIVTDDIRVKGDKRTYYIVDYFIPSMNLIVVLNNKTEIALKTPKVKYLKSTMYSLGYDVIEINDLDKVENLGSYMNGFKNSLSFRSKPDPDEYIYPIYFK